MTDASVRIHSKFDRKIDLSVCWKQIHIYSMFVMEHEHGRLLSRVCVCVREIIVCLFAFKKLRMRLSDRMCVCQNSLHCHYRRTHTQIYNAYINLYIFIKLIGEV